MIRHPPLLSSSSTPGRSTRQPVDQSQRRAMDRHALGLRRNGWQSLAVPVPLDQVHDGTNTIAFKSLDGGTVVANISLIIVAGAPVP